MKLKSTKRVPFGFVSLEFRYNEAFIAWLKTLPGPRYAPELDKGVWLIPAELTAVVAREGASFRAAPRFGRFESAKPVAGDEASIDTAALYPWQTVGAKQALAASRLMLAYEMGLGKSRTAIAAMCALRSTLPRLIVCPASVRSTWVDELVAYGVDHDEAIFTIGANTDWDLLGDLTEDCIKCGRPFYVITSYELAGTTPFGIAALVVDESHYIKSERSARSLAVRAWADANPSALILNLTGTPIDDDPLDIWNQLDLLFPKRFGSFFKFKQRYAAAETNKYATSGFTYSGLHPDPERQQELKARIAAVTHRVTTAEAAPFLPAFALSVVKSKPDRSAQLESASALRSADKASFERYVAGTAGLKMQLVEKRLNEIVESKLATHVCILTYLKSTARSLHEKLTGAGHTCYVITGDDSHSQRDATIERALAEPRAVLVASMHSVCVGINTLVDFTHAMFAELYFSPGVMLQAIKRFNRLNSTKPSKVELLVFESTIDELIARMVLKKVHAMNALLKAGAAEDQLEAGLRDDADEMSFLRSLAAAAKEQNDE